LYSERSLGGFPRATKQFIWCEAHQATFDLMEGCSGKLDRYNDRKMVQNKGGYVRNFLQFLFVTE
jgi:hypothetical protein